MALFVSNRLPVELVTFGAALALYFTGVLDFRQIAAGFGGPTVVLIAALFVVAEGIDATVGHRPVGPFAAPMRLRAG